MKNELLILTYHSIDTPKLERLKGIRVSPKNFEKQMRYLYNKGYKSYTLREAVEKKEMLDGKSLVITFDDGYKDNLTNALPILQKYGFKATIFVVINRFDNDWALHRKKKNKNIVNKIEKLSDNDIKTLLNSGLIEIGSHTIEHKNFSELSSREKEKEIKESKKILEQKFDIECKSFAYPFGIYDKNDDILVQKAGYITAVTTENKKANLQKDSLFLLPRVSVKNGYLKFILKMRKI